MDIEQMRERFRELNMPGVEYTPNSEVETLLEEVVNNDNARFFFSIEKDKDYQIKYDSLVNELKIRGIDYYFSKRGKNY